MGKHKTSYHKKHKKSEIGMKTFCQKAMGFVAYFYLFAIFMVMPLYIYDHYYQMAYFKWNIYLYSTLIFIGLGAVIGLTYVGHAIYKKEHFTKIEFNKTDIAILLYGISVIVTLLISPYPENAWPGTDGWYMGTMAQLLFVATYLLLSRITISSSKVMWMSLIAPTICYVIGIAQRYGQDFFHFYYGMPAEVIRDYLSTIGNRTWYSAYIAVFFPLGVYLFWHETGKKKLWAAGIYTFIAFGAIATNNSDSIFLALGAVMFALFVMSLGNLEKICRWLYIVALWFLSCGVMSLLRVVYPDDVRELRGLSAFILDIKTSLIGLIVVGGLILLLKYVIKKHKNNSECSAALRKKLQLGCIISAAALMILTVCVIILNTSGILQNLFGIGIDNQYLLFNDYWGDSRGFNWKITIEMFGDLPLMQKLFGIGSDCYAYHAYSNPAYAGDMILFWGNQALVANAHNEWLNALLCHGIIGCGLYCTVFIGSVVGCLRQCNAPKANPFVVAVGLSLLAYMAHNFFCYQQICATGPIFILMGMAARKMRKE